MRGTPEAELPPLYATWLREAAGGPIPAETIATCDRCVMLPTEGCAPERTYFLPAVKCCAYQPTLPSFLVGRILADADSDPRAAHGRQALEERIAARVGVVPSGVKSSGVFRLLYSQTPDAFGRAPALACPYLTEGGACGVWRHRPGTCATWFCKHVRGETGFRFWKLAEKLLRAVELDLAHWCAAEMDTGSAELANLAPGTEDRPHVSELKGPLDTARYRELWGGWEGREREFYLACAKLVEALRWADVLAICGPQVRVLARLVRKAHQDRIAEALPERLRLGLLQLSAAGDGRYSLSTYSPYDPLEMTEQLARALRFFDGRPTQDALAAIRTELRLNLDRRLVRRLVDFGVLRAAD